MVNFKSLTESLAHDTATKLGLIYYGFGKYGVNRHVTHINRLGRLIPVAKHFPASKGEPVLLHYEHLEDQIVNKGSQGAVEALDTLHGIVKGDKRIYKETKVDGSPSVFFGKHNGKFFVATKSLHNKDPKINYTPEDIERNHGHAPGLVEKLKASLEHLPKIYKDHGIMQGDVMFTKNDIDTRKIDGKEHYTFKPNTIRNAVKVNSEEGRKIERAHFGFAPHTKYNEEGERLPASKDDVNHHPDVYHFDPAHEEHIDLTHHNEAIRDLGHHIATTNPGTYNILQRHGTLFKQFVNKKIKDQDHNINADEFINYVIAHHQKQIESVKTEAAKEKKRSAAQIELHDLHVNKDLLQKGIELHQKIANLKDKVIADLDKSQPIKRFLDTESGTKETGPEGYVAVGHHGTHKLVNRREFSFANFMQNKEGPNKQKTAVVTIGRMSPPHIEHSNLINAVVNKATSERADPFIYVTHTHDNKKNPLTGEEKLELLKKMHPEHAHLFHKTDTNIPSLPHILSNLHKQGYKNVHVVLGDDRVSDFDYLNKYNGKFDEKGNGYKFDKLNIVSRHEDKPTDDGIHASDLRKAAKENDFESFRKGMHPNLSDTEVKDLMTKIKSRLK